MLPPQNPFRQQQQEVPERIVAQEFQVLDEQGKVGAWVAAGRLAFYDEQGTTRLQLGRVTVVNSSTKAETTYPAALVLFDEEGNVIESLPR